MQQWIWKLLPYLFLLTIFKNIFYIYAVCFDPCLYFWLEKNLFKYLDVKKIIYTQKSKSACINSLFPQSTSLAVYIIIESGLKIAYKITQNKEQRLK